MENIFSTQRDLLDAYILLSAARREAMDNPAISVDDYRTILRACDSIQDRITDDRMMLVSDYVAEILMVYTNMIQRQTRYRQMEGIDV